MIRLSCGLLASGTLGLNALRTIIGIADVNFVLTDQASHVILEFCRQRGIPVFLGNPRNGRVSSFLHRFVTDVVFSVNYLFIVEEDILNHPKLIAANIHGSLLPKYRGRTPHVWAIINNEKETGVTVHVMDQGCDTGDILLQQSVPISAVETGGNILTKYESIYERMIRDFFARAAAGTLDRIPQDHSKATYFGRRTPDDGLIDWRWQRERIYNWIRALARPYPGAFFFCDRIKYEVHACRFSDRGFDERMVNGTVLTLEPLTVKTPNGALELLEHNFPSSVARERNTEILVLK